MEHPSRVGKYEIERFLGGGMSQVYCARDSVLGRRVALKLLTGPRASNAESKARFLFEARTASNISHENIISVYDFGEDDGCPFMVMEFLAGGSLREAIKQGTLGDFESRMKIALQVARAVDFIHGKKIIHRDIKPENIHIDPAGKAKLMDFGIAKSEGSTLTLAGTTLGTPYYMSPEQVLGHTLTRQSDIYSFGVLLFEILTGTKPIHATTIEDIFHQIIHEPLNLAPIKALKLAPEVSQLLERCTTKQPAQRPPGLGAVCVEIEQILGGSAPRPAPIFQPLATVPEAQPPWIERLPAPIRTQTGVMLLVGAAVLAGVTLVYAILAAAHVL